MKKFENSAGGYTPPKVEALDVDVEAGFALTSKAPGSSDPNPMTFDDGGYI